MPTSLESTIASLSSAFASQFMQALRDMPLAELVGPQKARASQATKPAKAAKAAPAKAAPAKAAAGRARATSVKQIVSAVSVDAIVAILKRHKGGLRAELLRKELGAAKPAFNYHASKAIAEKKVRKTGDRRSTTYFAR